jgi:hypothetical protein
MRATLAGPGDDCPDASEVAAFVEGRLEGAERECFERHTASCQRCLRLLGTLARVDEKVVAAAEEPARARRAWWRWLVPATVAATAAGVYLLVQPPPPAEHAGAEAPAYSREAPADSATRGTPAYPRKAPAATRPEAAATVAEPPAQAVVADRRLNERADQAVGGAVRQGKGAPATAAASRPSPPEPAEGAPTVATPPAAGAPSLARATGPERAAKREEDVAALAESRAPAALPAEREQAKAEPVLGAPAETRVAPRAVAAQPSTPEPRGKGLASGAHWVEVSAPGGSDRWRFGPGTAVSRSVDGGRTWEPGATPAGVTAASSPAPSICWAVGRAGAVIATSDGVTWRRVPFIDTSDGVAVTAENASAATVTTAAGARYTTRDGGKSWAPSN